MPKKTYLPAADVLRVLAIGLVACFHIWQQSWLFPGIYVFGRHVDLTPFVRRGYMMVDIMLLLSGFLLYLPVARSGRPGVDALPFYRKRLVRILPSYLFAVLAALVFTGCEGPDYAGTPVGKDLLTHFTFTYTFFYDTYVTTNLNVALWTVAVEMQFYLLFPLLARAFRTKPWLTFSMMTALGLLCRAWVIRQEDITILFNQLPCMLDLYACGMLAAHLSARTEKPLPAALTIPASLLFLAGVLWVLYHQNPADNRELNELQMLWRLPLGVLGGGFLYFGSFWPVRERRSPPTRIAAFLSGISYNFYIWHQYLAVKLKAWHVPDYVSPEMPQMYEGIAWQRKYTWVCFLAGLAAAIVCTYLIEKPVSRYFLRKQDEKIPAPR